MKEYISVKEISERWGISSRRVQKMCSEGKIPDVKKVGRKWLIPSEAERPKDNRLKSGEYLNWRKNHSGASERENGK